MAGIISYGAYIPYNRLQRKKIGEFYGKPSMGGEKAVAGYDEDSVSMGVEAALDCLIGHDPSSVASLLFATTTAPYKEKGSAALMAAALGLRNDVRALEAGASLRSGTSALLAAREDEQALVVVADCRTSASSGQNEQLFGDGAAAFLMGSGDDVIAELIDSGSFQSEIVSQWRSEGDAYTQSWEERLGSTVFLQQVKEAVGPFLEKNGADSGSVAKVIISGPGSRAHSQAAAALGFEKGQVEDPLFNVVGSAGAAHAPMMLAAALEKAKPGDRLLVISFAEGLDFMLFEATDAIGKASERKGISGHLALKDDSILYADYLKWRGILETEPPRRAPQERPSAPALHRGYGQNLPFVGGKCRSCGTPQFPKQRVCIQCQAKDQMDDYRFYGQSAKVMTYTLDHLAASPAPPMIVAVVDFDQGGRIICEVTDCDPKEIEIGMGMEMTFRRLYEAGGISNYFWKARPIRQKGSV